MADLKTFGVPKGEGRYPEEIIYTLALLYNVISDDVTNFLQNYQLSMGKLNILLALKYLGGDQGIRQVEISQRLIVTPSNMTKMIDKLEEDDLVTRSALDGDRRVNIIQITKKGSALLDSLRDGYLEKLGNVAGSLDKNKQKQLAGLLTEWFEKI